MYHTPVLLKDCIEALKIKPDGIYVDATFGGGGHSAEILKKIADGKLIGFDQDEDAETNKLSDERFILVKANFRNMTSELQKIGVTQIDGLLADLGVSSHQFDTADRGFSTRFDSLLDMRMNKNENLTAAKVLNSYSENDLRKIFREYGEVENASRLAKTILSARKEKPIETISELKNAIVNCVKRGKENQYYAKVFQALRIEVNDELNALKDLLKQATEMLNKEGRIAVISYHSLEDRLVKNFFRHGKFEGEVEKDFYWNRIVPLREITHKPIFPSEKEIENNSRARSAKFRIAEKI